MDPEKMKSLNDLGFTWRVRVVRGSRRRTKSLQPEKGEVEDEVEEDEDDDETEEEEEGEDEEGPSRKKFKSLADYKINHIEDAASPKKKIIAGASSFHCSMCTGTIIYANAQCATCRGSYCENCFDEIRHDHAQQCPKCAGPVAAVGGGWNV